MGTLRQAAFPHTGLYLVQFNCQILCKEEANGGKRSNPGRIIGLRPEIRISGKEEVLLRIRRCSVTCPVHPVTNVIKLFGLSLWIHKLTQAWSRLDFFWNSLCSCFVLLNAPFISFHFSLDSFHLLLSRSVSISFSSSIITFYRCG